MTTNDRLNGIREKCRDAASGAADMATAMTNSASASISTGVREMREKSALSSQRGADNGVSSRDGDTYAAAEAGECVLSGELCVCSATDDRAEITITHSPGEVMKKCAQTRIDGFKEALHDRKLLTVAGIMALIWLILSLLPAVGINPAPVQSLSFVTFAQGGLTGGIPGFIGGLVGKGLIAYFVTLIIVGGISGDEIFSGIRSLFAHFSGGKWDLASVSPLLIGGGAALFIYNFLAGTSTILNCMVGVVAFLIATRSLMTRSGCVRKVFAAVFARDGKTDSGHLTRVMAGWAGGFALGVVLSVVGGYICYIAGFIFLVVGVLLMYAGERKGGVAA